MSVYNGKLLELVAIEKKSDKYFLHIKLLHQQGTEMLWEVDEFTGENLNTVTEFDSKYKYRLSFHRFFDPLKQEHKSILTRTYREQSDRIYFSCSEDYIDMLTSIKYCQNISQLPKPTFTFVHLMLLNEQQDSQKEEKNKEIPITKYNRKYTWASIAAMSVIFAMLFNYSSDIYLNKASFKDEALAQSMVLKDEVNMNLKEKLDLNDSISVEKTSYNKPTNKADNQSTSQPVISSVELNQAITYALSDGRVALTFDDGPSQYSMAIINVLKKYEVGGTFFFIGLNAKKYPDYVKQVQLNGYSIGSHSMNHVNVSRLSYEEQKSELIQSSNLLEEITGQKIILFRPPYGAINRSTKDLIFEHQHKMVLWNNDPKDWKTRNADKIFYDIQHSDVSGSIILLHESQATVDALPRIIEYLQDMNLQIVSLH